MTKNGPLNRIIAEVSSRGPSTEGEPSSSPDLRSRSVLSYGRAWLKAGLLVLHSQCDFRVSGEQKAIQVRGDDAKLNNLYNPS